MAQLRPLLDTIERHLGGALKHGKDRSLAPCADGIVAPFAGRDLAAVDAQDCAEFLAVEHDLFVPLARLRRRIARLGIPWRGAFAATEKLYRVVGHLQAKVSASP